MTAADHSDEPAERIPGTEASDARPFALTLLCLEEILRAQTPFAPVIEVWQRHCGEQAVPDWFDFEFAEFRGWHAWMAVSVFPDEEPDPLFKIVGEKFKMIGPEGPSSRRFSQALPRAYGAQFREHFRRIRDEGLIGLVRGEAAVEGKQFITLQVIELPVRRGGESVAGIIHVVQHSMT